MCKFVKTHRNVHIYIRELHLNISDLLKIQQKKKIFSKKRNIAKKGEFTEQKHIIIIVSKSIKEEYCPF